MMHLLLAEKSTIWARHRAPFGENSRQKRWLRLERNICLPTSAELEQVTILLSLWE